MLYELRVLSTKAKLFFIFVSLLVGAIMWRAKQNHVDILVESGLFFGLIYISAFKLTLVQEFDKFNICVFPMNKYQIFNILFISNLTGLHCIFFLIAFTTYFSLNFFVDGNSLPIIKLVSMIFIYLLSILFELIFTLWAKRSKMGYNTFSGFGVIFMLHLLLANTEMFSKKLNFLAVEQNKVTIAVILLFIIFYIIFIFFYNYLSKKILTKPLIDLSIYAKKNLLGIDYSKK